MNNRAKFEQMLELLVNENREQAEELFHELVVAKSKEIYESMLADEFEEEEEEEEGEDKPESDYFGGDKGDKFVDDVTSDDEDEGDDEEGEYEPEDEFDSEEDEDDEVTKDDILDIKDAIDELKAEFERMMSGQHEEETEESWEPEDDGDFDPSRFGDEDRDMPYGTEEEEEYEEAYFESAEMIKVGDVKHGEHGVNAKSTVAGKNDMGGTTANIAKAGKTETKGTKDGLVDPSEKEDSMGNVNVPGNKKAPKMSPVGKNWESAKTGEQNVNAKPVIGK